MNQRNDLFEIIKNDRQKNAKNIVEALTYDLTQPISTIRGRAEILKRNSGPELHSGLDIIIFEIDRVNQILRQLYEMTQFENEFHENSKMQVGIKNQINWVLNLLRGQIKKSQIKIGIEIDEDKSIFADPFLLNQIFYAILQNAIEALEEKTSWNEDQTKFIHIEFHEEKNNNKILSITDNGVGMDPDVTSLIFTPYFTTKSEFKAHGIGLGVAKNIALKEGWDITFYSEPRIGTTFEIHF